MTNDEALKLALEAMKGVWNSGLPFHNVGRMGKALAAIEEALAQPDHSEDSLDMVEQPEEQLCCDKQKPVAKVVSSGEHGFPMLQWLSANHSLDTEIGSLLYTAPPQRQPLTEGEIKKATSASDDYWASSKLFIIGISRAIEAKLKEKIL